MLGSGETRNKDVRSVMIWFLREKAGEGKGVEGWALGALCIHMTALPCGKNVFLTLNSGIAKSLSISGSSVIPKCSTGGREGKSEALGARQAKRGSCSREGVHRQAGAPQFPDQQ